MGYLWGGGGFIEIVCGSQLLLANPPLQELVLTVNYREF
jgi:hypothetical protein